MNKVIKYIRKMIGIIDNPKPVNFKPRRLRCYKLIINDNVYDTVYTNNEEIAMSHFARWIDGKRFKVVTSIIIIE